MPAVKPDATIIVEGILEAVNKEESKVLKKQKKKAEKALMEFEKPDFATERQYLFARHYVENGGNGADAARKAGYAELAAKEIGSRLLTYANVKKMVDEYRALKVNALKTTSEWKMEKLTTVAEVLQQQIMENPGTPAAAAMSSAMGKLISEMNKMQGHYAAEKIVTVNHNVNYDVVDVLIDDNLREY